MARTWSIYSAFPTVSQWEDPDTMDLYDVVLANNGAAMAVNGDVIYCIAGPYYSGEYLGNHVYSFDMSTKTWTALEDVQGTVGDYGGVHALRYWNGALYALVGYSSDFLSGSLLIARYNGSGWDELDTLLAYGSVSEWVGGAPLGVHFDGDANMLVAAGLNAYHMSTDGTNWSRITINGNDDNNYHNAPRKVYGPLTKSEENKVVIAWKTSAANSIYRWAEYSGTGSNWVETDDSGSSTWRPVGGKLNGFHFRERYYDPGYGNGVGYYVLVGSDDWGSASTPIPDGHNGSTDNRWMTQYVASDARFIFDRFGGGSHLYHHKGVLDGDWSDIDDESTTFGRFDGFWKWNGELYGCSPNGGLLPSGGSYGNIIGGGPVAEDYLVTAKLAYGFNAIQSEDAIEV